MTLLSNTPAVPLDRLTTPWPSVNQLLGGGLVVGGCYLLHGPPGSGKSTLALQLAAHLARQHLDVGILSGEESLEQLRQRAARLRCLDADVAAGEYRPGVFWQAQVKATFKLVVIDSAQTCLLHAQPEDVVGWARVTGTTLLLLSQETKNHTYRGNAAWAHAVDVVLRLISEDKNRYLTTSKNRHGPSDREAQLNMTQRGLRELRWYERML